MGICVLSIPFFSSSSSISLRNLQRKKRNHLAVCAICKEKRKHLAILAICKEQKKPSSNVFWRREERYLSTLRLATRDRNSWMGPKMVVTSANDTDKSTTPSLDSDTMVVWHEAALLWLFTLPRRHSSPNTPYVVIVKGCRLLLYRHTPICNLPILWMEKWDQDESHAIPVPEERELHCEMIIIPWQSS